MTRTGIEQGGGAMRRKQSPGGALFSPRGNRTGMSAGDAAPRMCELFYFVTRTGIEQHGRAAGEVKNSPVGCSLVRGVTVRECLPGTQHPECVSFFIL